MNQLNIETISTLVAGLVAILTALGVLFGKVYDLKKKHISNELKLENLTKENLELKNSNKNLEKENKLLTEENVKLKNQISELVLRIKVLEEKVK